MATTQKRVSMPHIYAVGEMMKSRLESRHDTKLLVKLDGLHCCKLCNLGGGEYRQWVQCDCFRDKVIQPSSDFYCMYWDLNLGWMAEVPESLYPEMLYLLQVASRVHRFGVDLSLLTDSLRLLTNLFDDLPPLLRGGIPTKSLAWLIELRKLLDHSELAEIERYFSQLEGP